MKLVSACLAGVPCRYDSQSKERKEIMDLLAQGLAIPVCPEQMGGLTTPRPPAENVGDKVFTDQGVDVTKQFQAGAKAALELALKSNVTEALLKSKSPMCGCGKIYDGTHQGKLIAGDGVLTRLLKERGISIREIE